MIDILHTNNRMALTSCHSDRKYGARFGRRMNDDDLATRRCSLAPLAEDS